jgi:hypothetical protein
MPESHHAVGFPTTCWSRVARAGDPADPEARAALEGLCRDYWYPLYAFVRCQGLDPEDASDMVQGFLADLLERQCWTASIATGAVSAPSCGPRARTTSAMNMTVPAR